ncbi:MAG: alpha/beta fold hydrolase [Actinomycetota bacterium]|nr:alpha/beta fold hydrolase [Actinomycetota bacterium]
MTDERAPRGPDAPRADHARLASSSVGSGRRLVLVHGFTQTGASWRRVAAALSGDHEVVAVDLPGHGRSGDVRVADLDEAAALVGATGGRAVYVGYSLGGRTCLTLALARPDLVEHLVLVGATAGIEDPEERAARRSSDEALARRLDPPDGPARTSVGEFLAEWLSGPLFAHLDSEQADLGARVANLGPGLAASLRTTGTGTQIPSWDRLGALSMPVDLVTGSLDARFGEIASRMARAIGGNARCAVLPGTGHAAPFEDPAAFASLVERLVTERATGR